MALQPTSDNDDFAGEVPEDDAYEDGYDEAYEDEFEDAAGSFSDDETRNIEAGLGMALDELEEMITAIRRIMPDHPELSDDEVVRCTRGWVREFGTEDSLADVDLIIDAMPLLHSLRQGIWVQKYCNWVGEESFTLGPDIPSIPSLRIEGCTGDFTEDPGGVLAAAERVSDAAQILYAQMKRAIQHIGPPEVRHLTSSEMIVDSNDGEPGSDDAAEWDPFDEIFRKDEGPDA